MKVFISMFNFLTVFFILFLVTTPVNAATYQNEFILAPKYVANDSPIVIKYKITGLPQNTGYYIKGRFYKTPTSGYSGNTYNIETNKWLKQSDAWANHPVITSSDEGTVEGSLILKFPDGTPETYNLQLVIRKVGSSVNDSLSSEVQLEVLDITESGNGGIVYGYSPSTSNNLEVISISGNEINSCYITEINNIDEGYENISGFFYLPVPAEKEQKIVIYKDDEAYVVSEGFNPIPGEIRFIELQELQPMSVQVIHPENNAIFSFLNRETFSAAIDISGGMAPYIVNASLEDRETGEIIDSQTEKYSSSGKKDVIFDLAQKNGVLNLVFELIDSVGNRQMASIAFIADSIPPEEPKLIGNLNFINKNNAKSFFIKGISEPGSLNLIKIRDSAGNESEAVGIQNNKNGKFQIVKDLSFMIDGYVHIEVTSIDKAGNMSETVKYELYKDTKPPIIKKLKVTKKAFQKLFLVTMNFYLLEESWKKVNIEIIGIQKNLRKVKYWSGSVTPGKPIIKKIRTKKNITEIDIKVKDIAGNNTLKKVYLK